MRTGQFIIALFVGMTLCGGGYSAAQPVAGGTPASEPKYVIKPSDVVLPPDVPLGQYRRSFRPFENWLLVCDENLKVKQMVCNVSQSIIDQAGKVVFSWSLAATQNGRPFMILRGMPEMRTDEGIELGFTGGKKPVKVEIEGCNQAVCLGKTTVGPILAEQIDKEMVVSVQYRMRSGDVVKMALPLKGLKEAVRSIK